jgi:F-type H+-transporting ATPase subunit epsilon
MPLDLHLVTPEREVWAGEADFVIARSVAGDIGILPEHAPTLAALAVGPVFIEAGGQRTAVVVDGGFLHIGELGDGTRVDILAEHAVPQDELSREDPAEYDRRADQLRQEERFDEARVEEAKAETRRRLANSS